MMVKHTERDGIDEQEIIASFLPDEPTDHNALVHAAKQVDEIRPSSSEVPSENRAAAKAVSRIMKSCSSMNRPSRPARARWSISVRNFMIRSSASPRS